MLNTPTGALTIGHVADELGTSPVSVLRLIARGVLRAAMVGESYRVSPTALAAFVEGGAKDFKTLDGRLTWFENTAADPLIDIKTVCAPVAMVPTNEQLIEASEGRPERPELSFVVAGSPEVIAAGNQVNANPFMAIFKHRNDVAETLTIVEKAVGQLLKTGARRSLAKLSTRKPGGLKSEVEQLYHSTTSYTEAMVAARASAAAYAIRWNKLMPIARTADQKPLPNVNVQFTLPLQTVAGGERQLSTIIDKMVQHTF